MASTDQSKQEIADGQDENEDYYQLLGVPYAATKPQIVKAYRAAMKHAHPDRRLPEHRAHAEETAKLLNLAFQTLTNPAKRRAYDESIKGKLVQQQIMNNYFGGFGAPGGLAGDHTGERFRRAATDHERGERRQANRSAIVTVLLIFGGMALAIVVVLLLVSVISSAASAVF